MTGRTRGEKVQNSRMNMWLNDLVLDQNKRIILHGFWGPRTKQGEVLSTAEVISDGYLHTLWMELEERDPELKDSKILYNEEEAQQTFVLEANSIFIILDSKHVCLCWRERHYLNLQRLFIKYSWNNTLDQRQADPLLTRHAGAWETFRELSPALVCDLFSRLRDAWEIDFS